MEDSPLDRSGLIYFVERGRARSLWGSSGNRWTVSAGNGKLAWFAN